MDIQHDKIGEEQLKMLEQFWCDEYEDDCLGGEKREMSDIRNELLKELEGVRRRLSRRRERREITGEELKEGLDAVDRLKELV